jgi:hypothetical protein
MRTIIIVAGLTLALGGCQTYQQQRAATGAMVGGATGAVIGGVAGRSAGAAVAGGAIGAASGAIIGAATTPRYCNAQTASGQWVRVRC